MPMKGFSLRKSSLNNKREGFRSRSLNNKLFQKPKDDQPPPAPRRRSMLDRIRIPLRNQRKSSKEHNGHQVRKLSSVDELSGLFEDCLDVKGTNVSEDGLINGTQYRSSYDSTLTPEDLNKAFRELNETPEKRIASLNELRKLLSREKGLRSRLDDEFLIRFLRVCKFNVDKAFEMIRNHYRIRKRYPEYFVTLSEVIDTMKTGMVLHLPLRDSEGRIIVLTKASMWDPSKISGEEIFAAAYIAAEYSIANPVNQINGYTCILDWQGMSMQQVKAAPISLTKIAVNLFQDNFPARYKKCYMLNVPSLFYTMWRVCKYLIKKKFRDRIVFLKGLSHLHEMVDPELLPVEYGGQYVYDIAYALKKLIETNSDIEKDRTYGYV